MAQHSAPGATGSVRRHERLRRGAIRRNVRRVGAAPGAGQAHDGAPGWPGQYPGETDWLAASGGQIALATDTEHNGRALAFDGDSCRIGARDRRLPRRHSRRVHRPVLLSLSLLPTGSPPGVPTSSSATARSTSSSLLLTLTPGQRTSAPGTSSTRASRQSATPTSVQSATLSLALTTQATSGSPSN